MYVSVCSQARYNWKLTSSISSFFFNNYISRAENGDERARFRVNAFLIYLYWRCSRYLSRDAPFEHFHNIWLNTSAIFLSDAKLTTRVRLITHETSGVRSPLSPRAIYYYTLQCTGIYRVYIYIYIYICTILARPTPP